MGLDSNFLQLIGHIGFCGLFAATAIASHADGHSGFAHFCMGSQSDTFETAALISDQQAQKFSFLRRAAMAGKVSEACGCSSLP